jgi:DnaK suppressor protein
LLSREFVERQRGRLEQSRVALRAQVQAGADEDLQQAVDSGSQAGEAEERAQTQAMLESSGNLRDRLADRLASIERALAKIAQGHYGYSDVSGQRIPLDRLEAEPEAACTVQEAAAAQS